MSQSDFWKIRPYLVCGVDEFFLLITQRFLSNDIFRADFENGAKLQKSAQKALKMIHNLETHSSGSGFNEKFKNVHQFYFSFNKFETNDCLLGHFCNWEMMTVVVE